MSNQPSKISFASENYAGVQEDIMQALVGANMGYAPSYGRDQDTSQATELFKTYFGEPLTAHFTFNGTGANNFGIACVTGRYHSVLCSDVAHMYVDESTAPENFIGCRLYPVGSYNGKIMVEDLKNKINRVGDIHHPQPKLVSITQPTEYGTVYTVEEITAIKAVCVENNLLLHVDGARFFNAAAHLGVPLSGISKYVGVDILTLGGTKAGMMFGEAVIFFNPDDGLSFPFEHKRSMQLASKNRFIAVQFKRMLQEELWKKLAAYTNGLAKQFENEMMDIPFIKIAYPVESNVVFLNMPQSIYKQMQPYADFYYWNEQKEEARFVFSFANTPEEIVSFAENLKKYAPKFVDN